MMSRKRFKAEEIVHKLREAEVLLAQGKKTPEVCKKLGVTEQTYYRWRREYGGLIELATQYGRYGSRRITAILRREGWKVNHKRIERLWRQEGLAGGRREV